MEVEELQQKKFFLEKAIEECISAFIEDTDMDRLNVDVSRYTYLGSHAKYKVQVTVEL